MKKFWKTLTNFCFLKRLSCYLSACCVFCALVCVFPLLSVCCGRGEMKIAATPVYRALRRFGGDYFACRL